MIGLMQVTMPTEGTNPYAWFLVIALGAIGFMFKILTDGQNKRTERCEKREDLILEDNRAQATTIKEQSVTLLRVASLAENTFTMAKETNDKIDDIRDLIERPPSNARQRS